MIHIEINGGEVMINGEPVLLGSDPAVLLGESPDDTAGVVIYIIPDVLTIRNSDPEENN